VTRVLKQVAPMLCPLLFVAWPNSVNDLRYAFNAYPGARYKMLRSASYPERDLPHQANEMRVR
jgi:hypothetical protein